MPCTGRAHPKVRASVLLRLSGLEDAPGAMAISVQEALKAYNGAVFELETIMGELGTTLRSHVRARTAALLVASASCQGRLEDLRVKVIALSDWRAELISARALTKKKASFKIGQYLKPLERAGTPSILAKYMVTCGLLEKPPGVQDSDWVDFVPHSLPEVSVNGDDSFLRHPGGAPWASPVLFNLEGDLVLGSFDSTL